MRPYINKESSSFWGKESGAIKIYENRSSSNCLGEVQYEIYKYYKNLLISNLITYGGIKRDTEICSRLMFEVQKIAKNKNLGIEFNVFQESAEFYKDWLRRSFSLKIKGGVKSNKPVVVPWSEINQNFPKFRH